MSTVTSNSKVYEDGELWSFIRRCMSQGKDIHLDHAERTYEEYSARLDVAALERLPELQAYIVRAVVAARGSNETGAVADPRERHAIRNALQFFEEYRKGYTPFIDPTMVHFLKQLHDRSSDGANELKADDVPAQDRCAVCEGVFIDHRHGAMGHDWQPKPQGKFDGGGDTHG